MAYPRATFDAGELVLSRSIDESAFVAWVSADHPEGLEAQPMRTVSLSLSLDQNTHPFARTPVGIRGTAHERARQLSII